MLIIEPSHLTRRLPYKDSISMHGMFFRTVNRLMNLFPCTTLWYVIDIGRCLSDKWFIGYGQSEWSYEAKPSTTTRTVRTR